jgi:hypothetical protein
LVFLANLAPLANRRAFDAALAPLRRSEWVVYAKRPFAGPQAVLAYLSRYNHRVAISNARLIKLEDAGVAFKWKDYRVKGRDRLKTMTLDTGEFIRRFLLHVLPTGFRRIRHMWTASSQAPFAPKTSSAPASCWPSPRLSPNARAPRLTARAKNLRLRFDAPVAAAG